MSMNFNDYFYIYQDSHGRWNEVTNPIFVAEHKNCKAILRKELPYGSVKIYLEEINKPEKELTEDQQSLYDFLCIDATTTTAPEDMDDTAKSIREHVSKLTDKESIIELEREFMSDMEMEQLQEEAYEITNGKRDILNEKEMKMALRKEISELLYTKAIKNRHEPV